MIDFNKIFSQVWEKSLGSLVKSFSARTSLQPDLPQEIWLKDNFVKDPRTALAVLMILPMCVPGTRNYNFIESLRKHIGNMCSNYNEEGLWHLVACLLRDTTSLDVYSSWVIVLNTMSEEDFFGNMVPVLRTAIRSLTWRNLNYSVISDKSPISRPQRKRGYNDKGSRRDPSRWLPDVIHPSRVRIRVEVIIKVPLPFCWYDSYRKRC